MTTEPGTVTVEVARAVDIPAIAALERDAFTDPWSLVSFESLLAEPAAYFGVARDGASIFGYVVAWFAADEGEVANLAVREPTRRRGIGAALLDAALAEGQRRGAANIFLEVRESNEAARRLYASRGFAEVGRRRRYYNKPVEDAVVLRRQMQ
jgi:[ribosomal protein S18]-alanine N-acetyltransferase